MIISNVKGRLGADAEVRTSKNGNQYVTMRVASNSYSNGETSTTWVRVTWVGDRAIKMAEHLKKGSFIDVWGELRASLYDTKTNEKAIAIDVMADRIDFVGGGSSSGNTQTNEAVTDTGNFKKQEPATVAAATTETDNGGADDLPF